MNIIEQTTEEQIYALENIAPLKEIQKFQILRYELLQIETKRLERKLGKDHPQTQQQRTRITEQLHTLRQIDKELELSKISVPDVPEEGALVHGRVIDKRTERGIVGLIVYAQDKNEKFMRIFGKTETKTSGYYAIQLAKEVLIKIQKEEVYLTITTRNGKLIHQKTKPLSLEPGAQLKVDFTLDRRTLRPTKKDETTIQKSQPPEKEDKKPENQK